MGQLISCATITKPVFQSPGATTTEPMSGTIEAGMPQSPYSTTAAMRSNCNEKPATATREKPTQQKTQHSQNNVKKKSKINLQKLKSRS